MPRRPNVESMSTNVSLSSAGPPETLLPVETSEVQHLVTQIVALAKAGDAAAVRESVDAAVRLAPRSSLVWWACARAAETEVQRYAAFRVGYHRGLDSLRANGWRGSGFVRWSHAGNVGFLRCLHGLQRSAGALGESDEEERCRLFLLQLDPSGIPVSESHE